MQRTSAALLLLSLLSPSCSGPGLDAPETVIQAEIFAQAASLALGAAAATLPQQPARPNIVVVLVDDLGAGDLSCYGADDLQTPAIDGFVARGMKFTQAYANCPVCSPTRAALLSGRYPEL
ncbi:MAG: sulfatase-like hydrolase/transferase, partial [Planctomycetota bacterium]|nr:sulfatase-like hydrolase/transferase [Planctomycetota bacterium]